MNDPEIEAIIRHLRAELGATAIPPTPAKTDPDTLEAKLREIRGASGTPSERYRHLGNLFVPALSAMGALVLLALIAGAGA